MTTLSQSERVGRSRRKAKATRPDLAASLSKAAGFCKATHLFHSKTCSGSEHSEGAMRLPSSLEDSSDDAPFDLDSCIDVIETLNVNGLTPKQQAAIRNLRASANRVRHTDPIIPGPGGGSWGSWRNIKKRRETKSSGFGRSFRSAKDSPLMTKELLKCLHEVGDNKEDTDQQNNVSDVLATYGGHNLVGMFGIDPHSEEKKNDGEDSDSQLDDSQSDGCLALESFPTLKNTEPSAVASMSRSGMESTGRRASSERRIGIVNFQALDPTGSIAHLFHPEELVTKIYCPPEWNGLTTKARTQLTSILSCANLSKWDFNVLDVADLSRETLTDGQDRCQFCPLLFVGWAILCAPLAQEAMEGSLGDNVEEDICRSELNLIAALNISPQSLCNFLRKVESGYQSENPYHNNIHAADVTQTLHCLLRFIGTDGATTIYDKVEIFSVLLAATFHDVGHPGTNNLFQKKATTSLAIQYNDASILENMHSSVGHSLLMGEKKEEEWDIFKQWSGEMIGRARGVMMSAVLATDMSTHFESMERLASLVEKIKVDYMDTNDVEDGKSRPILSILAEVLGGGIKGDPLKKDCSQLAHHILNFLLHAADISNAAKKRDLAIYWADNALDEFFTQGDREEKLGIPISPLCDRRTVKRADSQIGFLKFVILPTYALLGEILPRVEEEVKPLIDANILYWTREKSRLSTFGTNFRESGTNFRTMCAFDKKEIEMSEEITEE